MSRYGRIIIDGRDAWEEYGFFALRGSLNDWINFPEVKETLTHDWKDENGVQTDADNIYVKEKNVTLEVLFVADSLSAFWEFHSKAEKMLLSPGFRSIYYDELEKTFKVKYQKSSKPEIHTKLKRTNKVVVSMTIHFMQPNDDYESIQE